jgi:hypothetical protein
MRGDPSPLFSFRGTGQGAIRINLVKQPDKHAAKAFRRAAPQVAGESAFKVIVRLIDAQSDW